MRVSHAWVIEIYCAIPYTKIVVLWVKIDLGSTKSCPSEHYEAKQGPHFYIDNYIIVEMVDLRFLST